MITDTLENLGKYISIPHREAILEFLRDTNVRDLPEGDIDIKGKDLYVKVLRYVPKEAEENNFETHRVYTDVQVIVDGVEMMQVAPLDCLRKKAEYTDAGDFQFFSAAGDISDIVVQKGQFIVFFPQEAHRPGCRYQNSDTPVMKLVFKAK